ncbi:MAG: transcriptional repressor NrdR [Euzebyales bacterium]|jgi:transcriptional repressor NrdR|nr:transcriptional repressor NrdR [Euzebyales bacterium]
MRCPYCAADAGRVIDSRPAERGVAVRRRRECARCEQRYSTHERVEQQALGVRKRSGEVEPFERAKVLAGIAKATKNLHIDDAAMGRVAARVEARVRALGKRVVPSQVVGAEVLDGLRMVDDVAYMRFASVYKNFTTPDDFRRELAGLEKRPAPKSRHYP